MLKSFSYFKGIPTKVDVDKLIKHIGIPDVGKKILYEEINEILGIEKTNNRWFTVVTTWRKKLFRDHNVVLEAVPNQYFLCLSANERVSFASKKINTGKKIIFKGIRIAQSSDITGMDEESKKLYGHITSIPNKLRLARLTEAKDLPI